MYNLDLQLYEYNTCTSYYMYDLHTKLDVLNLLNLVGVSTVLVSLYLGTADRMPMRHGSGHAWHATVLRKN